MEQNQKVLVLDFGGQYSQLIARRIRDLEVHAELHPSRIGIEKIKEINPNAIIFTGGPNSVYQENSPSIDREIFALQIPILGICYGAQLIAKELGGKVEKANISEYGKAKVLINSKSELFKDIKKSTNCWMSHTDYIKELPIGFTKTSSTKDLDIVSMEDKKRKIYAVQFHPEAEHTEDGTKIISNFLFEIAKLKKNWQIKNFTTKKIEEIKETVGEKRVLLALSGGVDSSVVAALISKAIGKKLTCIFVDHGLLRQNEADEVEEIFSKDFDLDFIRVNAKNRFLNKLKGVSDPEKKRKIIGEEFIRVFEDEAKKLGKINFLAQGTIYPDIIESGDGNSATIKSHHNVGGLPDHVDFDEILEPLRELFKDEVRRVGIELNLPKHLVNRQPFPGPGLAVRVIGEITEEKLEILRPADAIFREELEKADLNFKLGQYFAVLTNLKTVGVMGDFRTYEYVLALRAVNTTDFMSAQWSKIPLEVLEKASSRISNEVKRINRIVYDITNKPPSTIEWE